MVSVPFPLKPGLPDVDFRFTIRAARDLERAAGCNYRTLFARGEQINAIVLLVCYGLRHADKAMTEEKAVDLVDRYLTGGGDIVTLYETLQKAMNVSGVYGPAAKTDDEEPNTEGAQNSAADPTPAPITTAT